MLYNLKKNVRIMRHCPELRTHIIRYSFYSALYYATNVPILLMVLIAYVFLGIGNGIILASQFIFASLIEFLEDRKISIVDAAHEILPIEKINERIGGGAGEILHKEWGE